MGFALQHKSGFILSTQCIHFVSNIKTLTLYSSVNYKQLKNNMALVVKEETLNCKELK